MNPLTWFLYFMTIFTLTLIICKILVDSFYIISISLCLLQLLLVIIDSGIASILGSVRRTANVARVVLSIEGQPVLVPPENAAVKVHDLLLNPSAQRPAAWTAAVRIANWQQPFGDLKRWLTSNDHGAAAARCASKQHGIASRIITLLRPRTVLAVDKARSALHHVRRGVALCTSWVCAEHQGEVTMYHPPHRKAAVRLRLAFPNWKLGVGRVVPPASHARMTPFLPAPASRSFSTKSGLGSI